MPHPPPVKKPHPKTGIMELAKDNKPIMFAYCPAHDKKSSNFQGGHKKDGSDQMLWLFRCSAGPSWMTHLFYIPEDPTAPRTGEEQQWLQKKLEEKAVKVGRGQLQ